MNPPTDRQGDTVPIDPDILPKDYDSYPHPYRTAADNEAVFAKRSVDAHVRRSDRRLGPTALGVRWINLEVATWLLERGADVDATDEVYRRTPLMVHVARPGSAEFVELLLAHGADVGRTHYQGESALHAACRTLEPRTYELLLAAGADPALEDRRGRTALDLVAYNAEPGRARDALAIARLLAPHSRAVGADPAATVRKNWKDAARWHEAGNLSDDDLAAFAELLEVLGLEAPAAPRRLAEGEPITVTREGTNPIFSELWDLLVPSGGPAATVQGEVVRIAGRVGYEVLTNGGVNWDADFEAMLTAYRAHVASGTPLGDLAGTDRAIAALRGGAVGRAAVDRLTADAVRWVLANRDRVPLPPPTYRR